jgi:putative tryptophan/tyrosine transport system substrate-binding protein
MRRRNFIGVIGGWAIWPIAVGAQQVEKSYRVGYLALLPGEDTTLLKPFSQRLQELGYNKDKNLALEYRSAEGAPERLARLAAELVQSNPDVLVAGFGTVAAKAAAAATKTIPVVFSSVGDPVGAGLVGSLGRPGANVTGMSGQANETAAKQLQILEDLVPGKRTVAVLLNPDSPFTALALRKVRSAATDSNQPLVVFEARTADQVSAGIGAAIGAGAAGLLTLDDPLLLSMRQKIVELVAVARLPTVDGIRDYPVAGGLMSYGPDQRQISRRAADYVDKLLKGAQPADLPVEQPTKFEFVINLKTAKALRLSIPPSLLATADEVIE